MRRAMLCGFLLLAVLCHAQQLPIDTRAKMEQATAAFRSRDFQHALELFNLVTAEEPQNILAHNLAGNCSLELGNYSAAAQSFQRALKIQPDQPQNLSGLARAYTLAGLISERDELAKHLRELAKSGKLPKNFGYVLDTFDVGDKKVLVTEFPLLAGGYHFRYQFDIYDTARNLTSRIALESDDIDQASYQKEHPKEAAEGGRRFSLDSYGRNTHGLLKFYDGEPPYQQVRFEVEAAMRGAIKPSIGSQYGTAPAQQPPTPPK